MCETPFRFNKPTQITNTDGTKAWSIESVVVLFTNEQGDDYFPRFYCNSLCASEWARVNDVRLQRPSSFPARYYEAIEQEPDEMLRPVVRDAGSNSNQGVKSIKRRSRMS